MGIGDGSQAASAAASVLPGKKICAAWAARLLCPAPRWTVVTPGCAPRAQKMAESKASGAPPGAPGLRAEAVPFAPPQRPGQEVRFGGGISATSVAARRPELQFGV